MNQLVQPQEQIQSHGFVPAQVSSQIIAQSFTVVMSVIMAVWAGAWVLSQVVKMVKGEEVERPPIILK